VKVLCHVVEAWLNALENGGLDEPQRAAETAAWKEEEVAKELDALLALSHFPDGEVKELIRITANRVRVSPVNGQPAHRYL